MTRARYAALEQLDHTGRAASPATARQWLPAAGLGLAAVFGVALWLGRPAPQEAPLVAIEDLELILAEDGLEMYEDLEFYSWLDNQLELDPDATGTDIG